MAEWTLYLIKTALYAANATGPRVDSGGCFPLREQRVDSIIGSRSSTCMGKACGGVIRIDSPHEIEPIWPQQGRTSIIVSTRTTRESLE